jgi:hypothetical protein
LSNGQNPICQTVDNGALDCAKKFAAYNAGGISKGRTPAGGSLRFRSTDGCDGGVAANSADNEPVISLAIVLGVMKDMVIGLK